MTGAQVRGDTEAVMAYMMDFYFESAAMILTLITVGKMLEARSKGRTTDALKGLMKLAPQTATVERDGRELEVPIEQVQKDDIFVVRPGESIPVDGVVLDGASAVNEAVLTGESVERKKPFPDIYLMGAERLGVQPRDCLVVEDAVSGIQAAHAAGMDAVGVPTTFSREELVERVHPEYMLNHIRELADLPELM